MDLKLFLIAPTTSLIVPISFISIQPIWNDDLKLATYQSYISDEVVSDAYKHYGIKTTYFENDKEVLSGFRSGSYDLAIVSSSTLEEAISQKIVKKIDWSRLSAIPEKYKSKQSGEKPFTDELFVSIINHMFSKNSQLYEYGVPYFLSYLTFVYIGEKLKDESDLNWGKLLANISADSRFIPKNKTYPKLGFIEDELTIFYLSKLISEEAGESQKLSKNDQLNFYSQLSKLIEKNRLGKLGSNAIFLHPNSALVSEMISSGQLKGAFMYNGDALYTYSTMKEEGKLLDLDKNFNIFEGKPSLWLLDSIAISSKISGDKEEKIYQFLNELLFKGIIEGGLESDFKINETSWAWKNFDYLKYTPTLKSMQKKLRELSSQNKIPDLNLKTQFEKKEIDILFGNQDFEKCAWTDVKNNQFEQKNICQVVFESSMNDQQNLNLALAFQRWKSNL